MGIDRRMMALMDQQALEQQELSRQFLALHPHLDVYEADPWSYEDNKAQAEFFAEAEARWMRERRELRAEIDAENTEAPTNPTQIQPGYWLTVTETEEEPTLLIRSIDGNAVEGYAVSSSRWELMSYTTTPALNEPALWQPVAAEDVPDVLARLHLLWDRKQQAAFDAQAPELVSSELTEAAVREGIVFYIVEVLKRMPDGLVVGFQPPGGGSVGSCGSGPIGPRGSWNFQVGYRVWGYPEGANDAVFDAFKRLFDAWDWTYRYEVTPGGRRSVDAWTNKNEKSAYHVSVNRQPHGGVSMRWTSPYYPGKYADREGRMRMPSEITKDGIQSWKPPVYK